MTSNAAILVVGSGARNYATILEALGGEYHLLNAKNTEDALTHQGERIDAVIVEQTANHLNRLDFVRQWRSRTTMTRFLAIVDGNDVRTAVDAMKNGAADCLVAPLEADEVRALVTHVLTSRETVPERTGRGGLEKGIDQRCNIDIPPDTSLEELERAAVEQALVQHGGNRTHAARTLGISVRTLQRKLKAWGMPIVSFPTATAGVNFALQGAAASAHSINSYAQ